MLLPISTLVCALALAMGVLLGPVFPVQATPINPISLNPTPTMHLAALPLIGNWFAGSRPTNLGVKDGKLAPCPGSPNCVVSQGNADADHAIAPIAYSGDLASTMQRLEAVVKAMPRTTIIEKTDTYLYAEFASQLMGYVDDVEFYLDPTASVIHVRSASRLGQSDLGVNRKRVEAIRSALSA